MHYRVVIVCSDIAPIIEILVELRSRATLYILKVDRDIAIAIISGLFMEQTDGVTDFMNCLTEAAPSIIEVDDLRAARPPNERAADATVVFQKIDEVTLRRLRYQHNPGAGGVPGVNR